MDNKRVSFLSILLFSIFWCMPLCVFSSAFEHKLDPIIDKDKVISVGTRSDDTPISSPQPHDLAALSNFVASLEDDGGFDKHFTDSSAVGGAQGSASVNEKMDPNLSQGNVATAGSGGIKNKVKDMNTGELENGATTRLVSSNSLPEDQARGPSIESGSGNLKIGKGKVNSQIVQGQAVVTKNEEDNGEGRMMKKKNQGQGEKTGMETQMGDANMEKKQGQGEKAMMDDKKGDANIGNGEGEGKKTAANVKNVKDPRAVPNQQSQLKGVNAGSGQGEVNNNVGNTSNGQRQRPSQQTTSRNVASNNGNAQENGSTIGNGRQNGKGRRPVQRSSSQSKDVNAGSGPGEVNNNVGNTSNGQRRRLAQRNPPQNVTPNAKNGQGNESHVGNRGQNGKGRGSSQQSQSRNTSATTGNNQRNTNTGSTNERKVKSSNASRSVPPARSALREKIKIDGNIWNKAGRERNAKNEVNDVALLSSYHINPDPNVKDGGRSQVTSKISNKNLKKETEKLKNKV